MRNQTTTVTATVTATATTTATHYLRCFLLLVCICCFVHNANSQYFKINIKDNVNSGKNYIEYHISQDSLAVNGVSDIENTDISFLKRVLKKKEKKRLLKFMNAYSLDSLKEYYFTDYVTYQNISVDNFPRQITIDITKNGKFSKSLITNSYAAVYAKLFEYLNRLLPDDRKIIYDKSKFEGQF